MAARHSCSCLCKILILGEKIYLRVENFLISFSLSTCVIMISLWIFLTFEKESSILVLGNYIFAENESSLLIWLRSRFSKYYRCLCDSVHYPYNFLPSSMCFLISLMHTSSVFKSFWTFIHKVLHHALYVLVLKQHQMM